MKAITYLRNHYAGISKFLLFILSIIILLLILPREGKFKYEFRKGKPWMHDNLIAPFDFAILKPAEDLEAERQQILKNIKPYFVQDTGIIVSQRQMLEQTFGQFWDKKYPPGTSPESRRKKSLAACKEIFDTIAMTGIIEMNPYLEGQPPDFQITVISNNIAEERQLGEFYSIQTADKYIYDRANHYQNVDNNLIISVLENLLVQTVKFDAGTTEKEKQELIGTISETRGMIQTGELVISRGELITGEKLQVLESLRIGYESKLGSSFKYAGILAGHIILLSVSLFALYLFLLFFRKEIPNDQKKIVMILLMIISIVLATTLVVRFNPEYVYIVPVCLVPVIVGIFNDSRLALFSHLITIIITGLIVPNSYEFVFLQLFAGIVTILSIVRLERRSQFLLTSLMIFITYFIIYTGMTLIKEGSAREMNYMYFFMFGGSAFLTFFSYPIIFLFEKVFGFITDITLLELSNTNNKLLRELALRAPGTFQHCMQVANLAEEAAYEIGANPLLVRTGAMYHDIGKMDDPLYFIENQSAGLNPHDELTHEESAQIIISHVTAGIEKAKKFKLPEPIIDFIRTHHGTRKTEYFYALAKKASPDEEPDAGIFTYHGPEPFSKETALLAMADVVEAASRTLNKPGEESISALVDTVITKQVDGRQFDNADITLRDIKKIKKIFRKKLMSIYHLRVEYPE
ncbi:MAG: HDIG domain-containing protein [Bacteroidetes bacterium]|nr:HDIG domain-containing protein [Bacteroidota bacterium]